jgi:hypothetical protein
LFLSIIYARYSFYFDEEIHSCGFSGKGLFAFLAGKGVKMSGSNYPPLINTPHAKPHKPLNLQSLKITVFVFPGALVP